MNCPFKKNHSRLFALVLVLTLLTGMLSGCFGKDSTKDTEPNSPPNLVDSKPSEETTDPPETTEDANDSMAVTTQQVNVRSTPVSDANIITTLDAGVQVEILQEHTSGEVEWALIREGWVPMEFLEKGGTAVTEPDETTSPDETKPAETTSDDSATDASFKGVITATELYIRKEPSSTSETNGSYKKSDVVTILETKNGWGRTSKGWISMDYVKTSSDSDTTKTDDTDETTTDNNNTTTTNTNATKGVVIANELNIRKEASTGSDKVGTYTYGTRISILETSNGWGRTDKGWISLNYVYQDGTTGSNSCKGVVTGTQLNVRSGPGTNYDGVKSLTYGDRVTVLERIKINGTTWGCISSGWICMDYVYVDGTEGDNSGTGTVTGDALNIRSGPGTTYGSVGSLNKGDTVKILAQFKIGDMTWGCTEKGWVSMSYVDMAD